MMTSPHPRRGVGQISPDEYCTVRGLYHFVWGSFDEVVQRRVGCQPPPESATDGSVPFTLGTRTSASFTPSTCIPRSPYVSDIVRGSSRMASLVQELKQDAYDSSASLSNMLRKAKAVAVKLQLKQPIQWVEAELNGYTTDEVPEYRKIHGRLKGHNPYRGLIPMSFDNSEIEAAVSAYWSREPVGTIEHILATTNEPMLPITGEKAAFLARMSSAPDFLLYLLFSPSSFQGILNAVRNRVLDWSLQLQTDGILGEGMSSRAEETAKVSDKGHTYNIGSIGNFAGNLGGQVGGDAPPHRRRTWGKSLRRWLPWWRSSAPTRGRWGWMPGNRPRSAATLLLSMRA